MLALKDWNLLQITIMVVPWNDERCILCLQAKPLSIEHVIPQSLGGILSCDFLCKPCNDRFGHGFEAKAKSDPAIRIAITNLRHDLPELYDSIEEGQRYLVDTGPAKLSGTLRKGQVRGAEGKLDDGSIIKSEENAPNTLRRMLSKEGRDQDFIERALKKWEAAPPDEIVPLSPEISVKKWHDRPARPEYTEPNLNPLIPLKIAYEFSALLLENRILDDQPTLNQIRLALFAGDEEFAKPLVKRLFAPKYNTFHGICFHRNDPEAIIEVRLFGMLAYQVRLLGVALQMERIVYTHDLKAGTHSVHSPDANFAHTD